MQDSEHDPHDPRFEGNRRLYGRLGLSRLQAAHVCIVGIGGVGTWVVEALARAGIGCLTLVDLDEICLSNVNRQLHALDSTVGRSKVHMMAERVRAINPAAVVHARQVFFTETNADELLAPNFDFVVDATDSTAKKCLMIVRCRARRTPIVTVGGAGGRKASTAVRVVDLARASHDRLLQAVRRRLRDEHGFPRGDGKLFGVDCVYSAEKAVYPEPDPATCAATPGVRLNCDGGYGSACHVTGAFGFAAAGYVIGKLVGEPAGGSSG